MIFPEIKLTRRQANLKAFKNELKGLPEKDLTPENISKMTKELLGVFLGPEHTAHKVAIKRALGHIKFNSSGKLIDEAQTYRKINVELGKMDKHDRMLLSAGMHHQGYFGVESIGQVAGTVLAGRELDSRKKKMLFNVITSTASAFMEAHKAAGAKYLTSLREAKYIE